MERIVVAHASRAPDATAVIEGAVSLTYAELVIEANNLSQALAKIELSEEEPVGILFGPGASQVITQLAVRIAGGTCVPIEPCLPEHRMTCMLQDVQAKHIITDKQERWMQDGFNTIYYGGPERHPAGIVPKLAFESQAQRSHILFTSGSSGKPKPVQLLNDGILHLARNTPATPFSQSDRVAAFNNPGFDLSLLEIWVTLVAGATIIITPRRIATDPSALPRFLRKHGITVIVLTTSLFSTITFANPNVFHTTRHVFIGGDVASVQVMRKVLANGPPQHLWNTYGPTECTTLTTMLEVTHEEANRERIGIGLPVGDMRVFLIDEDQKPIFDHGKRGEMCIVGPQQFTGYLGQTSAAEKNFIYLPKDVLKVPGEKNDMVRLYRTGDLGSWRPGSECLDFLGRLDTQIKYRGFRVELGEIERVLLSHGGVQGVVVCRQPPLLDGGMDALVAFIVGNDPSTAELMAFARERLPLYMVPTDMEVVSNFPMTPNGKIDRKVLMDHRLKRLEGQATQLPNEAGSNKKREVLQGLWKKALGVPRVHDEDDFFELGATSLQASTLLALIQVHLGCLITMESLYSNSKLSSLLRLIYPTEPLSQQNAPDNTRTWLEDVNRVENIELVPHWESEHEGRVFVTGATGFVGAHFLHHLLQKPSVKRVACLIRPRENSAATSRVQEALERYDLWNECAAQADKLILLAGDLSDNSLGLGADQFNWLSNWASIIFHIGAKINFCESYREHHASNVSGTYNALRLAATGRRKAFHYLSSIDAWGPTGFVLGTKELYEDEPLMPHSQAVRYDLGYSHSQWTAEAMVRRMRDRGLPTVIYRPGFILGDRKTGSSNPDDFVSRLIVGCIQLGTFPRLDQRLEYVTIDYVISAMLHIASSNTSIGRSYSLLSPDQSQSATVLDTCRIINEAGYQVKVLDYSDWVQEVLEKQRPDGPLASLLPMFQEPVMGHLTRWEASQYTPYYRSDNTVQALKDRPDIEYHPLDADMIKRFISFWNRKGFYKV
ncbi:hypothetical protein BDV25DRAFT_23062 [Aspergillus avenaceus]|uniref:Carrier domain-containing protein n=1 Tax=Aspergillus avenaceus TaxID=36643 RepID=A0A5N6TPL8_ASPAV|nr:hypothetical protein BDV25DRAFT_23062 [Aspergillus avenaceus]